MQLPQAESMQITHDTNAKPWSLEEIATMARVVTNMLGHQHANTSGDTREGRRRALRISYSSSVSMRPERSVSKSSKVIFMRPSSPACCSANSAFATFVTGTRPVLSAGSSDVNEESSPCFALMG